LLARLSQHNKSRAEDPRPVAVGPLIESIAAAKRASHPIIVSGDPAQLILADPARLEQALSHLMQNAIEASPAAEPVTVSFGRQGSEIEISVSDSGSGMSAAFIREKLFRPFASTKDGGFGIGAYEARSLIMAMNGRIEVNSREGEGSRFTIFLPAAQGSSAPPHIPSAEAA
jgi:signal transduction histidine kinase